MIIIQTSHFNTMTKPAKKLTFYSRKLRKNMPMTEKEIWRYLRRKQLGNFKFRRQLVIGNYITDFACPEAKVIVECDGPHHEDQKDYDDKRDEFLKSQGYTVLRSWNDDIMMRPLKTCDEIYWHCQKNTGVENPKAMEW